MPARTTLRAGYAEVAIRIQEAMDDLTSNDVRGRLSDAVRDATKDTGNWAYYIDHTGDEESGDVYYSCGGRRHVLALRDGEDRRHALRKPWFTMTRG